MGLKSILKKWWFWLIILILVIIIATNMGDDHESPAPTGTPTGNTSFEEIISPTPTVTPVPTNGGLSPSPAMTPKAKGDAIEPGMYKVGTDIPAGEYMILANNNALSYYQVSKDSSGSLESIVSNDNFRGNRYITVSDGQYIEFKDSAMYPVAKAPTLSAENNRYTEGMYKVGRDIAAGEYKLIPEDDTGAYVEVDKDSKGELGSIVSNDNFTTEKYITIKDNQYIKLVGCHITTE